MEKVFLVALLIFILAVLITTLFSDPEKQRLRREKWAKKIEYLRKEREFYNKHPEALSHPKRYLLKKKYNEALKGTDKKAALDAGREYYSELRRGKLTIYDEQAIANDLSTMS
jgi:hypothetical protein